MKIPKQPRRTFLKQAASLAAMPMIVPGSVLGLNGAVAPSNRITVGGIGLERQGGTFSFFKHSTFNSGHCRSSKERREIVQRWHA